MMIEYLPLFMFATLLGLILLGFPVAYTLAGTAILFGGIGHYFEVFYLDDFGLIPNRIWGMMTNYTLVAVPLFVFMGLILEKSKIAEELLTSLASVLRGFKGSLAYTVVLVGALLAASTGIVGATVVTMGILAAPAMLESGYDRKLTSGVITASGTLGQIIPPSIVLVLLGDVMNLDVGDLFVAAMIPGFMLVGGYLIYIFALSKFRPCLFGNSNDQKTDVDFGKLFKSIALPVLLMFIVMGSIIFGLASPTEAAACGAFAALAMALVRKKLTASQIHEAARETATITAMVFTLLVGAQFFGVVFRGLYGEDLIAELISSWQLPSFLVVVLILALIFALGFFLDFLEICFIVIPIVLPILKALEINTLWIAILFAVNLQTSFLTPPFGFALFYFRGVAAKSISTAEIYRGAIPFVLIQIIILSILLAFPALCTWLPGLVFDR